MGREEWSNIVEGFLTTLYTALDDSHQEYEQAIRGEILSKQNPIDIPKDVVRFAAPGKDSSFEPPFGQPGRAVGGDPRAIALAGSTAIDGIEQAWDKFGQRMQDQDKIADLKLRIQKIDAEIVALQAEAQTASPSRKYEIEQRIFKLEQERAALQKEIDQLAGSG
jgi:hypothetical protein